MLFGNLYAYQGLSGTKYMKKYLYFYNKIEKD